MVDGMYLIRTCSALRSLSEVTIWQLLHESHPQLYVGNITCTDFDYQNGVSALECKRQEA